MRALPGARVLGLDTHPHLHRRRPGPVHHGPQLDDHPDLHGLQEVQLVDRRRHHRAPGEPLGNNPNIQFLSFSLDPDDTPDMMKQFASGIDIKDSDHWWFLNGPKDEVRKYMTTSFQFRPVQDLPVADRLTPDDKYIHDLRVAVVDHEGHVRGLYDIMNADPEFQTYWDKQIRTDLNYLLEEQKKQKK